MRARLAVGLVLMILLAVTSSASASALTRSGVRAAGTASPAASTAVQDYGSCLSASHQGDLLLLIDQSGSLRTTDPQAARVTAADYLLQRLSDFDRTAGVTIDVSVAGFSDQFTQTTAWTPLTSQASLAGITADVARYRQDTHGGQTDYWAALEGARRLLADHAGAGGNTPRCQAIAWFSDGKLDLSVGPTAADRERFAQVNPFATGIDLSAPGAVATAQSAAVDALCRDGGLADQLRSSGVVIFGVGLAPPGTPPSTFDLMSSVTTGTPAGSSSCGGVHSPAPGQFALASDIDDLLFAFDAFSTPGSSPLEQDAGICQKDVCSQGAHHFVLDSSISTVHILGSADAASFDAVLVAPSGKQLVITPGSSTPASQSLDGVGVTSSWPSSRSVAIDLTESSATGMAWTGGWSLVFVDPSASSPQGTSRSSIHISGDLRPTWSGQGSTTLHRGEVVRGTSFGVVDAQHASVDPRSVLGSMTLSASITDSSGARTVIASGLDKAAIGRPSDLDLTHVAAGAATMHLQLAVTTADAVGAGGVREPGTVLSPQVVDVPVTILQHPGLPVLGERVDFGRVDGVADVSSKLAISGPGCVWFDDRGGQGVHVTAGPDPAAHLELTSSGPTSAGDCLKVAKGHTASVPLHLATAVAANATVNGTFTVGIEPIGDPSRATTVRVPFTADLRRPIAVRRAAAAFVLTFLVGLALPLGLAYGMKWLTARVPARALGGRLVPVVVSDGRLLREGSEFTLRDDDVAPLVPIPAGGARQLVVDGVQLRTRTGRSPVGAGHVVVQSPGRLGASSATPASKGRPPQARLPLALHNTWVLLHDPSGPADAADLLVLLGGEASAAQRAALAEDARARVPRLLAQVRADAGASGPGGDGSGAGPRSPLDGAHAGSAAGGAGPPGSPFDFPDLTSGGR